jgi:hypothetical protein
MRPLARRSSDSDIGIVKLLHTLLLSLHHALPAESKSVTWRSTETQVTGCVFNSNLNEDVYRLPPWSSIQSSWLQIQRSGSDYWRYQILCEVVGLERGPLSLVSTIERLLERKSSGSGL